MSTELIERLGAGLAGRYRLERELGRGGMAVVLLAEDLKHHRPVAVKVLHPEIAATVGPARFLREIELAARLAHPHILPLHDSGEAAGLLYYVMPYVAGESLRDRLRRERQLPLAEALRIAREAGDALDYAHGEGIVHRDVKPENILLQAGHAVVSDFGIAKALSAALEAADGEPLTGTGLALGTPYYMSPEQAMAGAVDGRSDLYSLACVLYEMLAGEPPFTGPTAQAVLARRVAGPVPSVRLLRPAVPAAVERALERALAVVPADRFAGAAEFAAALEGSAEAPAEPAGARARASPSVAVLPFLNLSADPENEFFADGVTEDVIAQLSKIRALKVISRTSVMAFKGRERNLREIGAALRVGSLLEGSVRRAGDRVRIVAQLVDAESDRHLWAETYDRRLDDIFRIQSDVALQIATALHAELTHEERARVGREPTRDLHAYQLYLQGRHCRSRYTEEAFVQALGYFEQAIAADPGFALAWAGIALIHAEAETGEGGGRLMPVPAYAKAKEAVARALALDPTLGEAHGIVALLAFIHDYDWAGAERAFRRALELEPNGADIYDHYGWMCMALERWDDALALLRRAQELDPMSHGSDLAATLLRAGRFAEAEAAAARVVEFDPSYARGHSVLGWAWLNLGRTAEGLAELERAAELAPNATLFMGQLGQAYALAGQPEKARGMLRRMEAMARLRYVSPYHVAYVHTGLGEHDRAIDLLEQAYEQRAGGVYGVRGSFLFRPLREHPRFRALLRKMNLAD